LTPLQDAFLAIIVRPFQGRKNHARLCQPVCASAKTARAEKSAGKAVSPAGDGLQALRVSRIGLDFLAKAPYQLRQTVIAHAGTVNAIFRPDCADEVIFTARLQR